MKTKRIAEDTNQTHTLASLKPGISEKSLQPSSLYIHIPFCLRKCAYCDFFSVPYDESFAYAYTNALCKELYLKRASADRLKTVYLGGGTPSLLPDSCFNRIFSCLKNNFHFTRDAEISVEANPGTLTQSKVDLLVSLGVNRMSLGIQSLSDSELKILGRIHAADDAIRSLDMMRISGLRNVSIDLMYGIPGQSLDSWHETIVRSVEYLPKHISAYELTLEEGTRLYNEIKNPPSFLKGGKERFLDEFKMPHEDIILDMYDQTIDHLQRSGYTQYEISNFAQSGFRCLHNLNYWERGEYIGAGAGAHSFLQGKRSVNVKDIHDYIERLNSNQQPERESTMIPPAEILKEFLFLGLRVTEGICITDAKNLGLDIVSAVGELVQAGYLAVENDSVRFTRKGIVLSNSIYIRIFEKLGL